MAGLALLALALAPAAQAEVTLGSDLTAAPSAAIAAPSTTSQASLPGRSVFAPFNGVITRWSIKAGTLAPAVRLVVLRRPAGTGLTSGEVLSRSAPVTPTVNDITTTGSVRIRIAAGEYIGLECCATPGDYLASSGTIDTWTPPLDVFAPADASETTAGELLVNAVVETDVDGDGLGDESQDVDDDSDGITDDPDNCETVFNQGQEDADGDGLGDACDDDRDGDGFANAADVCPTVPGPASGCAAPPAAPRVNTPPAVRFRTPLMGGAVRTTQTIELDVADDAGAPAVSVFDDDGTICTLTAAPYTCTWRPTGADVGRATLLASAVDSDGVSTLGIVRVKVPRFKATLTQARKGRRVSGTLKLPAAVERSLGCRGEVTVRRGKVTRTDALSRTCAYSVRLPKGKGKVRARFGGNPVIAPT